MCIIASALLPRVAAAQTPPPREDPAPYRKVHVLAIGVDDAPGFDRLKFAASDAQHVALTLQQTYGFSELHVLTNSRATRSAVDGALSQIRNSLDPARADDVMVFFSGHGVTRGVGEGADRITRGFLVLHEPELRPKSPLKDFEAKAIEMKSLVDQLAELPARHRLLLLDSCFGGLAFAARPVSVEPPRDAYQSVIRQPTVQVITAGLDREQALEVDSLQGGLFAHSLLVELREAQVRTVEEVFLPLRARVRDYFTSSSRPATMTPQHRYLVRTNGTFVFVPLDRMAGWAALSVQESPLMADARAKGYYEPVPADEVEQLKTASSTDTRVRGPEWQQKVDRYEARAAMGDPNAMAALALIFGNGLGVPQNPNRAGVFAGEARDTLKVSALFGVKDPVAASLLDTFVHIDGGSAGGASPITPSWLDITRLFGPDNPMDSMAKNRSDLLTHLQASSYDTKRALEDVRAWRASLDKLAGTWSSGSAPAEIGRLRDQLDNVERRIKINARSTAERLVRETDATLSALRSQLPSQPANNPPK